MLGDVLRERLGALVIRGLFRLPSPLLARLAGKRPEAAATLHPDAWLLARLGANRLPIESLPAHEARARFVSEAALLKVAVDVPVSTEDCRLPGPGGELPARLYVPEDAETPGPLLVYFHGGGWVIGSVETHDLPCRMLAHQAGVRILSVDYRLAPEHPFPAAVEDAVAAVRHAASHTSDFGADPGAIGVGGDSAGGNLATVTCLLARDGEARMPAFQFLLYPVCDLSTKHRSYSTFAEGYLLTDTRMDWFAGHYVPEPEQRRDVRASPLLADDLSGLPPAYIATSAADPLRDEGEAYAARLRDACVRVALHRQPLLHGFVSATVTRSGREALAQAAGALRQGLAPARPARKRAPAPA